MRAQLLISCLLVVTPAKADYVLGPPEVNTALKNIGRAKEALTKPPAELPSSVRAETLFALAAEAEDLAQLINLEIASHGFTQKGLIDLTTERCARLGVQIFFDDQAQRFLYDRTAFAEYIELAPNGPDSGIARFLLIERAFERQDPSDQAALRELIDQARALRNVDQAMACELDYFMGISYLRLSKLKAAGSTAEKRSFRSKAGDILTGITRNCRMTPEATLARRELQLLNASEVSENSLQTKPKESPR